jgi:hypothetical protein
MIGDTISREDFIRRYGEPKKGETISGDEFRKRYPEFNQKQPGFLASMVREIGRPFGKLGATIRSAVRGVGLLGQAGIQKAIGLDREAMQSVVKAGQPKELLGYETIKSTREAAGVGAEIGFTIVGFRMGAPKTILQAAKTGATLGTGLGAAQGLQIRPGEKLSTTEVLKAAASQAFVGGLIGAGTGAVFHGLGQLAKSAPQKMYDKVLKVTNKLKQAGKDPSKTLLEQKLWGTLGGLANKVDDSITTISDKIDDIVFKSKSRIKTSKIINDAVDILEEQFGKGTYTREQLEDLVMKAPASGLWGPADIDIQTAREIQKSLYRITRRSFYLNPDLASSGRETTAALAKALKNQIQPLTGTQKLFTTYSNLLEADKLIAKQTGKGGLLNLGVLDYILGGTGFIAPGIGTPEALLVAKKIGEQPIVRTGTAVTMHQFNKVIEKLPLAARNRINQIGRTTFLNLINDIFSSQ